MIIIKIIIEITTETITVIETIIIIEITTIEQECKSIEIPLEQNTEVIPIEIKV